ncbi:MAG TPA: glycosyltransferase family 2 protein, partial [Steroidobacteraceae bacterium]
MRSNLSVPPVSVIIPAYNAAAFLHRAVHSALKQSIPVLEVLIVDDASTDDTVAIADALSLNDSRIRLLTLSENSGPSVARNAGLEAAKGQWVAILDADDAYLPERLEWMLQTAIESDADIVVDNIRYYDPSTDS